VRCSVAATLGGAIYSNMDANFLIAFILSDPGCLNEVVGVGCSSACVRSTAAMVAVSALEITDNLQCWGKNSIVSLILSFPVVERYTLWAQ
jgi:hypothetical protein